MILSIRQWISVVSIVFLAAITYTCSSNLQSAWTRAGWFQITGDEANHVEIIESLAHTKKYSQWNGSPFALELTTGPAVLVPSAIASRFFEMPGILAGRLTVMAYHLLLLFFIWRISILAFNFFNENSETENLTPVSTQVFLFCLSAGVFHLSYRTLPETSYYLFGVLGEGPMAAWMAGSIWANLTRRHYLTGLMAALTCFSKPYAALFPISILLFAFIKKDFHLKHFLLCLAGALTPVLLMFIYGISWLGFFPFFKLLKTYPSLMRQVNHAGLPTNEVFTQKNWLLFQISSHFRSFCSFLNIKGILIFITGMGSLFYFSKKYLNLRWALCFFVLHTLWWLTLSPGSQSRYLFPLVLITGLFLVIMTVFLLNQALQLLPKPYPVPNIIGVLTVFIVFFIRPISIGIVQANNYLDNSSDSALSRSLMMQKYWKKNHASAPTIYSTSKNYDLDKDMALTAENHFKKIDFDTQHSFPDVFWIAVGEAPELSTSANLKRFFCKLLTPPILGKPEYGFWSCHHP